jgi:hypothetical protein
MCSPYFQLRRKIIIDVMNRFPDFGSRTLANKVFNETPEYFNDVEHVREMIRYYRGASGKKNLMALKNKDYVRKSISTT